MRHKWILLNAYLNPFFFVHWAQYLRVDRERSETADHMDLHLRTVPLPKQKRECSDQCGLYCLCPCLLAGTGSLRLVLFYLPPFILRRLFQLLACFRVRASPSHFSEREKEPSTALPSEAFFVTRGERRGTERAEDHMVAFFWVCDSFCLWSFASFSLLMTWNPF